MERFLLFLIITALTLGSAVWMSDSKDYWVQELPIEPSYVENLNDENITYDFNSEHNNRSNSQTAENYIEENRNNNDINNSFSLSHVVNRFINEKIITVKGIDLKFNQIINSNDIFSKFGEPSNVSEEFYSNYEYTDFRLSIFENKLISVGYYNLNIGEKDIFEVLGEPHYFYERNEYNQKIFSYNVYFNGEEHGENYITLDFAFGADGALDYFTIN